MFFFTGQAITHYRTSGGYVCSPSRRSSVFCHLALWLLQLPPRWFVCICNLISAAHPECRSALFLQPAEVFLLVTLHWLPVAGPIQDSGTCPQCCRSLRLILQPWLQKSWDAVWDINKNHSCLLSWLHDGETSSPLTSGRQKLYTYVVPCDDSSVQTARKKSLSFSYCSWCPCQVLAIFGWMRLLLLFWGQTLPLN